MAKRLLPDKQETSAYYHDLRKAFSRPGCPVCRLVADSADRYLDAVLWEMVLDRQTRADINEARGYCREHGWLLDRVGAALGTAILTRGVLKTLLDELGSFSMEDAPESTIGSLRRSLEKKPSKAAKRVRVALEPERRCPACSHVSTVEQHIVSTLLMHFDSTEGLAEGFAASDGLCQAHFRACLAQASPAERVRRLISAQRAIWQRLYDELGEFIRKKDFQHKSEAFGPEKDSWLRALASLSGTPPRYRSSPQTRD
jgi:hypothetical protein